VSMLNAAAIVVFVNKAQPLQAALTAAGSQLSSAQHEAQANLAAKLQTESQYNTEVQLHLKDNKDNAAAAQNLADSLNKANVNIATLEAGNTGLQSQLGTAQSNVQLSTATANKLQDQVTQLRNTNDSLAKSNEEYSHRNAELTSTLESLQARMEETQEQLAQSKTDSDKLKGFIKGKGYSVDQILQANVAGVGAPDIQGTISDKSVINGVPFVTISVGSNDGVTKGMKFDVVDGLEFLGIVTVDTVDTDNSIGRLEPVPGKEDRVQKGNEVKTQIRGS